MAKFWHSGMIDKKIVREREQAEYINRLEMSIHFLKRELNSEYGMKECSIYGNMSAKEWKEARTKLIADDYDEVRVGDNVILDFGENIVAAPRDSVSQALLDFNKRFITTNPKTPVKDTIVDACSYWLKRNAEIRCDADIEFGRRIEELENENNTRTLRQEE